MTFLCKGMSSLVHLVGVGVGITQGGHWFWKHALLLLFERFRGVKDNGSEIGWVEGEKCNDIFV